MTGYTELNKKIDEGKGIGNEYDGFKAEGYNINRLLDQYNNDITVQFNFKSIEASVLMLLIEYFDFLHDAFDERGTKTINLDDIPFSIKDGFHYGLKIF